ncbi:MAG: hypothetical protein AAF389_11855 [Gemmatimonadota bacterium]
MQGTELLLSIESFGVRATVWGEDLDGRNVAIPPPPGSVEAAPSAADVAYLVAPSDDEGRWDVDVDEHVFGTFDTIEEAVAALQSDLHHSIALHAPDHLFVHAGVVAWRDRAIAIPGRTLAGKSTLVLALARAGATYFSDEFAVIDADGGILPYRRALSERVAGSPVPRRHPAASLSPEPNTVPLPLGGVLQTTFAPDAAWKPAPVSAAESMMALLDNTVVARLRPDFAMARLSAATRGCRGYRSVRGDAEEAAAAILELFDDDA